MNLDDEIEIIKKRKDGLSVDDICREYKINRSLVYRIINRNGREKLIPNKKYSVSENYFENIDSEDKAYWLGFMYADGYVNDKKGERSLQIGLIDSDRNHIELFANCIGSNHPIRDLVSKSYIKKDGSLCKSSNIRISNSKMVDDLIKNGCMNNKSWTIKYPNFLKSNLHNHFIRGYFDGDGGVYKKGPNQYNVSICGNYEFIKGLQDYLLNKTDVVNSYILNARGDLYTLNITNYKDSLSFYNLIYGDMLTNYFLKRKKDVYDNIMVNIKNKNIKRLKITGPDNRIYIVDSGLRKFCIDNKLNYSSMKRVSSGYRRSCNGWKIEILSENLILRFNDFK